MTRPAASPMLTLSGERLQREIQAASLKAIEQFRKDFPWPKDFFDQTEREIETIMMAAARKKKMGG